MQALGRSYVLFFNDRYERTGALRAAGSIVAAAPHHPDDAVMRLYGCDFALRWARAG